MADAKVSWVSGTVLSPLPLVASRRVRRTGMKGVEVLRRPGIQCGFRRTRRDAARMCRAVVRAVVIRAAQAAGPLLRETTVTVCRVTDEKPRGRSPHLLVGTPYAAGS